MRIDALRKLYPKLSIEELERAKDNLDRYLLLAWEISEDKQIEDASTPAPSLTQAASGSSMEGKVDSPPIN
jgi:hypothetical protein